MKVWYLSIAVFISACAYGLHENEQIVVDYAQEQLQEAFTLLLDLNKTITSLEQKKRINRKILDITTERQALRLLHNYRGESQQTHLEQLSELYENHSLHPLLKAARILQEELS